MTSYYLHESLSYCLVDGRPIFLDTGNDRYFRLAEDMERAFIAHLDDADIEPGCMDRLVRRGILTPGRTSRDVPEPIAAPAIESAMEHSIARTNCGIGTIAEVFALIIRTRRRLRSRRLQTILDELCIDRSQSISTDAAERDMQASSHAHAFLEARRWVPSETRCLLDSISLVAFMARRNVDARIVFGVTGDPFSAHCWVQRGGLVLNDTIGNTRAYTVIRTV